MNSRRAIAMASLLALLAACGEMPPEPEPDPPPSILGLWELQDSLVTTSSWGTLVDVKMEIRRLGQGWRGEFGAFGTGNDSVLSQGNVRVTSYQYPMVSFELEPVTPSTRGDLAFTARFDGLFVDSTRIEGHFHTYVRVIGGSGVFLRPAGP
jgi:hypothetical protein